MNKIRYNFYTDNEDKSGNSDLFVHFWLNASNPNKVSLKCKVDKNLLNTKSTPYSNYSGDDADKINFFLGQVAQIIDDCKSMKRVVSAKELKDSISSFVSSYHGKNLVGSIDRSKTPKHRFTFIDLFAGAGGFSEGFMQAHIKDKWFDFLLGSDIDENCELTHHVRYNHQMGLGSKFLRKNITDHDFIDELKNQLVGQDVDVVAGGPPCQSFSMAGRRREFDVKNDLFHHYLKVIRELKPKYFIMENVKGIINKDKGRIKEKIINRIRSIVDESQLEKLSAFIDDVNKTISQEAHQLNSYSSIKNWANKSEKARWLVYLNMKLEYEITSDKAKKKEINEKIINGIQLRLKDLIRDNVPYIESKSNPCVNTLRRCLNMFENRNFGDELIDITINYKSLNNIDNNDKISESFDEFLHELDIKNIQKKFISNLKELVVLIDENNWKFSSMDAVHDLSEDIITLVEIYGMSYTNCVEEIGKISKIIKRDTEFQKLIESISLYKISDEPLLLDSSNYGVPQKRERVVFLGCRRDQKFIKSIPSNTADSICLETAISDLDTTNKGGKETTYSKMSNKGRMPKWYNVGPAFYVKSFDDLEQGKKFFSMSNTPLNSERSNQSDVVKNRLKIIRQKGGYDKAKKLLDKKGLLTQKRNYNLLNPTKAGPTMVTLPDDFIHYNDPRPLTVREMARIQSFDDDFVFQGKRTTGGNRRKMEIPQYTLVGNAVPPLMAKSIANAILRNIN